MNKLFLDIETIPGQAAAVMEALRAEAEQDKAACKAPANYKDPEKIAANIAEQHAAIDAAMDEKWRKTSFDGAYGQIAVIGFALNDDDPCSLWLEDWEMPKAERHILTAFNDSLSKRIPVNMEPATCVVGHNVSAFDLRFLVHRSIICGVRPHPVISRAAAAKPWESERVYDTMIQWAGVGGRIKLDKLCKALGLPGKGDVDGSKVWDYVRDGRISEIADYCADDVRKTRDVYRRMTFAKAPQPVEMDDVPA